MSKDRISGSTDIGLVQPTISDALDSAGERLATLLARAEKRSVDEMRAALTPVLDVLHDPNGTATDEHTRGAAERVPARYVDALRAELLDFLHENAHKVDGRELVQLLRAMDHVGQRPQAPALNEFAGRLASADALQAVIEIAHDMRSPLSSILFLVDTIRRGQSGPVLPVQERQLGLIYSAAFGLSTLASDAIDAVRGNRLVEGRPLPFSIREMILHVCAIVQPIGEEKGLTVQQAYPQRDGRIGYSPAIGRVLLNLTSNALRYTDRGSVAIGCTELSDTRVEFWVTDTGRGIPDRVLTMLFDGFRPGSVGMRFSSAGLGLAICRSLLEAMESTLKVETAIDKGTRFAFEIELPIAE